MSCLHNGYATPTEPAQLNQGIIDMNRNGNSANFFSYVCNGKKIEELFTSTLDRIPISARCVSSMIVVPNTKFALLLAGHANKNYDESRRSPTTEPRFVSWNNDSVESRWLNRTDVQLLSQLSLCTQKTSQLYSFQRSVQAKSMVEKSARLAVIPQ